MDALLFICTKEEQRSVIRFLWAEVVPGVKMLRRMSVQNGNSVVSQWIVCEWVERFRNGHTRIKREEGDGCPSTEAHTEQICDMFLQNRQ